MEVTAKRYLLAASGATGGNWLTVFSSAGSYDSKPLSMDVDIDGDLVVAGIAYLSGAYRIFIQRLSADGSLLWQKYLSTTLSGYGFYPRIRFLSDGSIAVVVSDYNLVSGTSRQAISLVILDADGSLIAQSAVDSEVDRGTSSPYSTRPCDLVVDLASDDLYVAGSTTPSTSSSESKLYLVKFNSAGTLQWQRRLAGTGFFESGNAVVLDGAGGVFVGGGDSYATSNTGMTLAKYTTSGALSWQKGAGAGSIHQLIDLEMDSSGSLLGIGGAKVGVAQYVYYAKYDSSGVVQWANYFTNLGHSEIHRSSLLIDDEDGALLFLKGTASPVYLVRIDSSGQILWQRSLSCINSGSVVAGEVRLDGGVSFYACGMYDDSVDGDHLFAIKLPLSGAGTGTHGALVYAASSLTTSSLSQTTSTSSKTGTTDSRATSAGGQSVAANSQTSQTIAF